MRRHSQLTSTNYAARLGATLAEVLMSLMIMGIGVVSLATLFPISTLRVLEATNLTNSTVLRFNAEGLTDSFPYMIHEPDGNQLIPGGGPNARTREAGRNYVVDPLGWHERYQELDLADDGNLNGSAAFNNPSLIYFEANRPATVTLPLLNGTFNGNPYPLQTRFLGEEPVNRALFTNIEITRELASLPDTTTDIAQGLPDPDGTNVAAYVLNAANRIRGIVLPASMDITTAVAVPTDYQVVVFDKSGRYSETRRLTAVGPNVPAAGFTTITWEQDLNGDGDTTDAGEDLALPLRFTQDSNGLANMGRVRVEQPVPYYSWMLSVRKRVTGPVNVDVVVFNKRDFSQISEQLYVGDLRRYTLGPDNAPGMAGVDDNLNGITDDVNEVGYPPNTATGNTSDDQVNDRVVVDWDPAATYAAGVAPAKPRMRRGSYLFDPVNGLWYRIRAIEAGPTTTSATLVLETSISRDNTDDLSGDGTLGDFPLEDRNNNGTLDRGGVLIPVGVVAVFPLETKLP